MLRCYPLVVKQSSVIEAQKSLIERLRLVIDPGRPCAGVKPPAGIEVKLKEDT